MIKKSTHAKVKAAVKVSQIKTTSGEFYISAAARAALTSFQQAVIENESDSRVQKGK